MTDFVKIDRPDVGKITLNDALQDASGEEADTLAQVLAGEYSSLVEKSLAEELGWANEVREGFDTFGNYIDAARVLADLAETTIKTINLTLLNITDPFTAIAQVAKEAIDAVFKGLFDFGDIHFLIVLGREHIGNRWTYRDFILDNPKIADSPSQIKGIVKNLSFGVKDYIQIITESLNDSNDLARPQFDSNYAVTGGSIFFTSPDFLEVLYPILKLLGLFKLDIEVPTSYPLPQNFTATLIPKKNNPVIYLNWDRRREIYAWDYKPRKIFKEVIERRMLPGEDKEDADPVWVIIEEREYSSIINDYFDEDSTMKYGYKYEYRLGWTIDSPARLPDFWTYTSIVVEREEKCSKFFHGKGVPPNWYKLDVVELFPGLASLIKYIQIYIDKIIDGAVGAAQILLDSIQFAADILLEITLRIDEGLNYLQELTDALESMTDVKSYLYSCAFKNGGMQKFVTDLSVKIGDSNFDPSHYVTGIVFVTGNQSWSVVENAYHAWTSLFSATGAVATTDDKIKEAVGDIYEDVERTKIQLDDALNPVEEEDQS